MSLAREAAEETAKFFEDVGRGLIRDAIEFRRSNPCYFARFRRTLSRLHKQAGHPLRAKYHARWAMYWEARCKADEPRLAGKCLACKDGKA